MKNSTANTTKTGRISKERNNTGGLNMAAVKREILAKMAKAVAA